ncbi:hypothetical protein ACNQVK_24945 [Mycobacterium sp. 134]|uniref:hypothetical protein n=1 Tax=Mycobacterium sp. 134 TaxID=3400425 RepID=UPI003AAAF576
MTNTSSDAGQPIRRVGLQRTLSVLGSAAIACYAVPPALYAWLAQRPVKWDTFWEQAAQPYATLAAGIGAITAGVLAYYNGHYTREAEKARHDTEQNRHRDERIHEIRRDLHARFTTATAQLDSKTLMTRQAGVHAIVALADDWHALDPESRHIQTCLDVLCSYLRKPWAPDNDIGTDGGAAYDATDKQTTHLAEERAVRETIYATLRQHLHPDASPSWSDATLNLSGAHLYDADLSWALIHAADFSGTVFKGKALFDDAQFRGKKPGAIKFNRATFIADGNSATISFQGTTFHGKVGAAVSFNETLFCADRGGIIDFNETAFFADYERGISFHGTEFTASNQGRVTFDRALFSSDRSRDRHLHTKRPESILFQTTTFAAESGGTITFFGTHFEARTGHISFPDTKFVAASRDSRIAFDGVDFEAMPDGRIDFETATFAGDGTVSFNDPERWNVHFAWDGDPLAMPAVVIPQDWPPHIASDQGRQRP